MKIRDAQPPFDNADLLTFEREIGATLPVDYRNFLRRHNGGKPSLSVFNWSEQAYSDSLIRQFFSLGTDTDTNLRRIRSIYQQADMQARVPLDVLPIADDDGGNLVCIGIQGERYGKLFFWNHGDKEEEEEEQESKTKTAPSHACLQLVAENFNGFLRNLQKPHAPNLDPLFFLDIEDYKGLEDLIRKWLGTEYAIPYQNMTLLEYSCRYQKPELTELMLKMGAIVTDKALEIARSPMGNARSLELVEEAARVARER